MFRRAFGVLLVVTAFAMLSTESFAGGGKNSGTLVVKNGVAGTQVGVVVDPPAAWANWPSPPTAAQQAEFVKRATVINATGSASFKLKRGSHTVLAVNLGNLARTITNVAIYKKYTTNITVNPVTP